jgi:general secretion pathway protein J
MKENTCGQPPGWKNRKPAGEAAGGFTLLELLISITLLVLIIVLMMGAMRMGSRSVTSGEKKMQEGERYRAVISLLDAQIQSQVPLTHMDEGNRKYYFRGEEKVLRLATNYSLWGAHDGYVLVEYRVETDPDSGKEILHARESAIGVGEPRDIRLMDVSSLSFEYFRKDGADEEGKWVASLAESDSVPEQIRMHLTRGNIKTVLLFPLRTGGRTLSLQSGAAPSGNISSNLPGGTK